MDPQFCSASGKGRSSSTYKKRLQLEDPEESAASGKGPAPSRRRRDSTTAVLGEGGRPSSVGDRSWREGRGDRVNTRHSLSAVGGRMRNVAAFFSEAIYSKYRSPASRRCPATLTVPVETWTRPVEQVLSFSNGKTFFDMFSAVRNGAKGGIRNGISLVWPVKGRGSLFLLISCGD